MPLENQRDLDLLAHGQLGQRRIVVGVHPLIPPPALSSSAPTKAPEKAACSRVAAAKSTGKKILYICGEGSHEKKHELMVAAGADMALMVMLDCVVEHPDVQLDGMLGRAAVAKHLPVSTPLSSTHIRTSVR